MQKQKIVTEIGLGTDIRGRDYTKAACRALKDALWHNSLGIAEIMGVDTDSMWIEVMIGIPEPDKVNKPDVLSILPHRQHINNFYHKIRSKKSWIYFGDDETFQFLFSEMHYTRKFFFANIA